MIVVAFLKKNPSLAHIAGFTISLGRNILLFSAHLKKITQTQSC